MCKYALLPPHTKGNKTKPNSAVLVKYAKRQKRVNISKRRRSLFAFEYEQILLPTASIEGVCGSGAAECVSPVTQPVPGGSGTAVKTEDDGREANRGGLHLCHAAAR